MCRSSDSKLQVQIKVASYFALSDGEPIRYCHRATLPLLVFDRQNCGLLKLVDYIGSKYIWGSKQYLTLWRGFDDDDTSTDAFEIKTDEQLRE